MTIISKIDIYEIDGQEVKSLDRPKLIVSAHWNRNTLVVIEAQDGKKLTVVADQLERAIANARNHD